MRRAGWLLLAIGALLSALNLYGLTADFAQDVPEKRPKPPPGKRAWLSASLQQKRGEPDAEYFRRLTMSLHYRITHSPEKHVVPPHENWLLYAAHYVVPSYRDYEYADYRRALERGAGLCTQYSAAIFDLLKRQGLRRKVVQFQRHTVVAAKTQTGREYVLDADFGVVLPMSMAAIRRNPALVRRYYGALEPKQTPLPQYTRQRLAREGQLAYSSPLVAVLTKASTPQRAVVERIAYAAKWSLPLGICLGAVALLAVGRRRRLNPDP
jgi:hypothetical protein